MGLVIDTNVWIHAEKGFDIGLERWASRGMSHISALTASELLVGLEFANTPERRIRRGTWIENLLSSIPVLDFDLSVARTHARMLAALPANVTPEAHDAIIGATALHHGCALLTRNVKDFKIFSGLEVLEWTAL